MYDINFKLNEEEKIVIEVENSLEEVHCCYRAFTFFVTATKRFMLSRSTVLGFLENFSNNLKKALGRNLIPHESIIEDIGFLWNEAYRDKPGFVYEGEEGEVKLWVGDSLRIWESGEKGSEMISVWIYNNKDGEIILEITPDYPWYECDPQDYENYIPYEEWIKSYKPLLIRTIPKEVAKNWVKQADEIVKQIEENANTGE